jgi:hypothetical protein
MLINYGNRRLQDSEQVAHYGLHTMIPDLQEGKHTHVLAKNLLSPSFARSPKYTDVTRDPDDTIVHDHDRHVLLIRSGLHVPDDTLICDHMEGIRALARAGVEQDIAAKLKQAPVKEMSQEEELLEALATGFRFLQAGLQHNIESMVTSGHTMLRSYISNVPLVQGDIKEEIYRTLVRAHHEIPDDRRDTVKWDSDQVDAMVIGAGTGHARSLLHLDYRTAKPEELHEALGGGLHPTPRGLHYASFEVQKSV